jgi:hypothetical protein
MNKIRNWLQIVFLAVGLAIAFIIDKLTDNGYPWE